MTKERTVRRFERSKGRKTNPLFSQKKNPRVSTAGRFLFSDTAAAIGTTCGVLFLIWYTTIYSSFFYFSEIRIDDTKYIPRDRLQNVIENYLSTKRAFIFPTQSYPYFSSKKLSEKITGEFGATYSIEKIEISTSLPRSLHVTIHERVPSVVWIASNSQNNAYYMVDREGVVAQFVDHAEQLPESLPVLRDANRTELTLGGLATSKSYIAYILEAYSAFEQKTGLPILNFEFPKVECQELQYVMEQIFEDEIADASSDEFKQQKLAVQQRFKNGELTIDQSLDALDQIKREEISAKGNVNTSMPKMRWQQVSVTVPCDYSQVSKELRILSRAQENTFSIYLDAQMDLSTQLYNFTSSVAAGQIHPERLEYFDARYEDRAYFKEK